MGIRTYLRDHSSLVTSKLLVGVLLALITLLALGLRLYRLDGQSLWYDEGFSVYLAQMDPVEITARTAADIQPPLYYYLLHGWIQVFGDGERALRGLSLLFGVLTVPLIYSVAWQLFRNRLAGLLAALLLAVSPLHVWYGQEVRMYTLLTFLCLLSSYLLLLVIRSATQGEKGWQTVVLWVAYTLSNIAALYTHYFAFFVLLFQGLYLLLVWWERGLQPARLILGGLASGLITILAYLAWLPYLLARYGQDVSYWPGQLKLPEVLLDIALFFVGGESVLESVGTLLALGYGTVFVLCLAALVMEASSFTVPAAPGSPSPAYKPAVQASRRYPLAFLLLYLIVPPVLILILSYNLPKFNPRYVMVAHPALLLIVAGGLAALWHGPPEALPGRSKNLRNLLRGLAVLALTFVLGVSAYANYNAYTDPAFARADFRGAARYIRRHIAPDETIILSSGHMFPVFDYYAPGTERHLLPDSPTLDATRTIDYAIATDLNEWLAGRDGVWLVLWQDQVVDPVGYLTTMLAGVGEEQTVDRGFPQVELRHYRLPPVAQFSDQPVIDHPADFNFGNRLHLLGYAQTGEQSVALFWEALQSLEEDYRVSITLRDTQGQSWGQWDGRPSAYVLPTDRWPAGRVVFGRYSLTPVPGAPPGDYGLEVGVYTEDDPIGLDLFDEAGAPQGKRAMLGSVRLSVPPASPSQIEVPNPGRIEFGDGLALLGWDLDGDQADPGRAQPGDQLSLALIWSVESQPQDDYRLRVLVTDEAGQVHDAGNFPPTNIWHPTTAWEEGQAWRGQVTFRLPIQAQSGEAQLSLELADASGAALGPPAFLGTLEILSPERVFTAPQPLVRQAANYADKTALLGADVDPVPVKPGEGLEIVLYWQALADMDIPYTAFVHLLGPDGRVVIGHDGEPASGARPTTNWVPGEFVADSHKMIVPAELQPGRYSLEVGLYDAGAPGMPRLPVLDGVGREGPDSVILGLVEVR